MANPTRSLTLTLCLCVTALCAATPPPAAERYGDALTDAITVRIGDLLANPEPYLDQRIRVEGLIEDICPMKGCWIDILEAQSKKTIRFKVEDDVIVFPAEARGQEVIAEGTLRKYEMSKSQAIRYLRHLAEERGESFDESTVTGPVERYELEGHGALLSAPERSAPSRH